jgi:hypothetical protein
MSIATGTAFWSSPLRATGQFTLSHDDAEAIIEAVAFLDCDGLGKATRGDGEVVEEAGVAE